MEAPETVIVISWSVIDLAIACPYIFPLYLPYFRRLAEKLATVETALRLPPYLTPLSEHPNQRILDAIFYVRMGCMWAIAKVITLLTHAEHPTGLLTFLGLVPIVFVLGKCISRFLVRGPFSSPLSLRSSGAVRAGVKVLISCKSRFFGSYSARETALEPPLEQLLEFWAWMCFSKLYLEIQRWDTPGSRRRNGGSALIKRCY